MIETFKMISGMHDKSSTINFNFWDISTSTRGNKQKIFQEHIHYNLRKNFFQTG